jgi:amidase
MRGEAAAYLPQLNIWRRKKMRPHANRKYLKSTKLTVTAASVLCLTTAFPLSAAETFKLEEASIADIRKALDSGALSSVELTVLYLNRVAAYDNHATNLNSIPIHNPKALEEAAAADRARAAGRADPLLGVPYTVKDSYRVKGMTVASGSPAFAKLTASEDAFTVAKIREAGGVLIGRTNMPPLASGGMQKGVYGRAESPYNADYLTAAWASGSSNGSATSTAANFAVFGMGEETVSSGRSPASNNALVAYTPSRGMLSIRGNWPLFPVRDVVVPQTRTMNDMLELLNVIQVTDPIVAGDFWREQKVVMLPTVESIRPADMKSLARTGTLKGKRIGVPTMYINKDPTVGRPITTRPSVMALWEKAADDLRALGAEVVEIDFTVMHNYDMDRPGAKGAIERGIMPEGWMLPTRMPGAPPRPASNVEFSHLNPYFQEEFVKLTKDPNLPSWTVIDPEMVFPAEPGGMEEKGRGFARDYKPAQKLIASGMKHPSELDGYAKALQGLEDLRRIDFEDWMKANQLDLVVFPAQADVGKSIANMDEKAYEEANRNGVFFSHMNHVIRHLGIPSVSVPMGTMADIGMPMNLTFIGAAYTDPQLLSYAYDYEQKTKNRTVPKRTPPLADEVITYDLAKVVAPAKRTETDPPALNITVAPHYEMAGGGAKLSISGTSADASGVADVRVYVNGRKVASASSDKWSAIYEVRDGKVTDPALTVTVLAKDKLGNASAVIRHFDVAANGTLTALANAPLPPCEICAGKPQ